MAHFDKYLKLGYFPYYLQSLTSYYQKLNASVSLIIETEIPMISNIEVKNIITLKRFLNYIAASVPYTLNVTKVAEIMQVSRATIVNYLTYLNDTEIINSIYTTGSLYGKLSKPEKILLHNPNLCFCLSNVTPDYGTLRETFFMNQLKGIFPIEIPEKGDFLVSDKFTFEVGGKSKTIDQIKNIKNSYIAADNIEYGTGNKIPLWLFGFLY